MVSSVAEGSRGSAEEEGSSAPMVGDRQGEKGVCVFVCAMFVCLK